MYNLLRSSFALSSLPIHILILIIVYGLICDVSLDIKGTVWTRPRPAQLPIINKC